MNWWVLIAVIAMMFVLRWRRVGMLVWAAAWWLGILAVLSFGFEVPIPTSVIQLYMGIVTISLLAFILTDRQRMLEIWQPIVRFVVEPRYRPLLIAVVLLVPALVAFRIYAGMTRTPQSPSFARSIHPASPELIQVHDAELAIGTMDNPYRELEDTDPEAFRERVEIGRRVYYQNCFYCHGDLMQGDGMYAHALNPIPTNFSSPDTLPILREAFVFWRVAKGAPGLPEEGGPWESAMPAWENFLTTEEMWNVVLFLYEFTDQRPRAVVEHH